MSDTVKLIIEIPDYDYKQIKEAYEKSDIVPSTYSYIYHGTPLDNNSEQAEVQAYFCGEAFGWDEGREDLCDKISEEIEEKMSHYDHFENSNTANGLRMAKEIVEKYKGVSE